MKLRMIRRTCPEMPCPEHWDVALVGSMLDDRGRKARWCVEHTAASVIELGYNQDDMCLLVNGDRVQCDDFPASIEELQGRSLILETTTLGFPEILLTCKSLIAKNMDFSMMYLEPKSYNAPRRLTEVLLRRDFELSDRISGFRGIPGTVGTLDETGDQMVVFLVGYEGARLERALEDLPLRPERCHVVFGVPAFQPGWEMDAFSNNVPVICERQLTHGVSFCGAENPDAMHRVLEKLYRSHTFNEGFFVAPLGTKPHAIGAALFACSHPDTGILYDHPQRMSKRSSEVGPCHVYHVLLGRKGNA